MGAGSALLLAAAFAAAPAPDAFRFDGPSASATVGGGHVALRVGGAVREGTGSGFLRGEDRVRGREMTYGDAGELWMRAQAGGDVYRVELDAVGFPPEAALPRGAGSRRAWWRKPEAAPRRPDGGVEGGVVLGRVVNGGSGLGVRDMPARRAAVALWGIGRVYRNDELVAPRARIVAEALPAEAPPPREGALAAQGTRPELDVFVDQVPAEVAPGGVMHFVLEGAAISEAPAAPVVARRGEPAPRSEPAARRKETREERLSRRPTADEMWSSGGPMLVWREERAPAPAGAGAPLATSAPSGATTYGPEPAGANAPTSAGEGAAGAAANTAGPSAAAYGGAPVGGANASSPAMASAQPDTRPGASTVMVPPPPLMAVPATPLTAPIQYETGQNGGTLGMGLIGGGGGAAGTYGAPYGYGGSGSAGTGVFNQATPAPSGVFAPGPPAPGTPTGGTSASPGIPATPPILNNGTTATPPVPSGAPTSLPQTPQPINAQPAPIPGATAPVPTQLPPATGR